jgi:hypothetical protein
MPDMVQRTPGAQERKSHPFRWALKKIFPSLGYSEIIQDIAATLSFAYTETQSQLGGYDGPMTYNPLTSLQWGTSQHSYAARLLKGSHQFNAQQLQRGKSNSLCYIQNIPVDQHTNQLSDTALDKTVREATLMADIALLCTFTQYAHHLADPIKTILRDSYYEIKQTYYLFLQFSPQGNTYFCEMPLVADLVREKLRDVKRSLASVKNAAVFQLEEPVTMIDLVMKLLMRLYSNNHHWNKQFGMLVQALSTVVERACRVGCPNTDPLLESVMSRVYLLESLNRTPLVGAAFTLRLRRFVAELIDPEALQEALDDEVNKGTLYTQIFTNDDTGGCSPLEASASETGALGLFELDSNIAESGYLTALQQKHTAGLRAQDSSLKPADKLKTLFAQQIRVRREQVNINAAVTRIAYADSCGGASTISFAPLFQESGVDDAAGVEAGADQDPRPAAVRGPITVSRFGPYDYRLSLGLSLETIATVDVS